MEGKRITVADVRRRTGVGRSTLFRWIEKNLIPPLERARRGRARKGHVGVWPGWVLGRVRRIRQLQDQSYTLDAIRSVLAQEAAASNIKRLSEHQAVAAQVAGESGGRSWTRGQLFLGFVVELLGNFGFASIWPDLAKVLTADDLLPQVLLARAEGHPLALVFNGRKVERVPIVALAHRFERPDVFSHHRVPQLVIPLELPLMLLYDAIGEELPDSPIVLVPGEFLRTAQPGGRRERVSYDLLPDGGLKILSVKADGPPGDTPRVRKPKTR